MFSCLLASVLCFLFAAGFTPSHGFAQQFVPDTTKDDLKETEGFVQNQHPQQDDCVSQQFQAVDEELDQLRADVQELKGVVQGLQSAKSAHLEERLAYLEAISRKNVPHKTCEDFRKLGVTESGSYLVDPDGPGIGDPPVMVFCDFSGEHAATVIQHDVEGDVDVDHCKEAGCHKTTVTYKATSRQLESLKALSLTCSQEIKYKCFVSPLIENTKNTAWWVGINNGVPHYFWDGGHNPSEHVCACSARNTCVNKNFRCNCDASALQWLTDEGVLQSDSLPVTELRFGGLVYDGQQANFSLGPLKCFGRKTVNPILTESCDTLRMAGHTASGYYFIDGPGGVHYDLVKCNMDAETKGAGFQQSPTAVKLAEKQVAFDFVRQNSFGSAHSVVTYGSYNLNNGEAMSTAGTFTAPFDGVYAFLFLYDAYDGGDIQIRLNGRKVAYAAAHRSGNASAQFGNGATAILQVLKGQTVDVILNDSEPIGGRGSHHSTHFTGFLLYPL